MNQMDDQLSMRMIMILIHDNDNNVMVVVLALMAMNAVFFICIHNKCRADSNQRCYSIYKIVYKKGVALSIISIVFQTFVYNI